MRPIRQYDAIALLDDLPHERLERGNVGTIVEIYNEGEAYEVEFVDTDGRTYGLLALRPEQFIVLSHHSGERVAA